MKWIKTREQLPAEGEWVLVAVDDIYKPIDVMKYEGMREGRVIGSKNIYYPNMTQYEKIIYPCWTRGRGDILGTHPYAWASLRDVGDFDN